MSEQAKSEWRGIVKNGKPIFAIGYLNITNDYLKTFIEDVFDSVPDDHVLLRLNVNRPNKEVYCVAVGLLGKKFTILPVKIFGKYFPRPPKIDHTYELAKKKS